MRPSSKSYTLKWAIACGFAFPSLLLAQGAVTPSSAQGTCAGLLADNPGVSATGPDSTGLPSTSSTNTGTRTSADTAAFGIGGARNGAPDVILQVAVQANQVRFAKQPNVRVRLCWGGDTLRVVQRTNIPSPVVAGTTYRNVYVAVELLGRLNGECLANAIGVGNAAQQSKPPVSSTNPSTTSASNCAFLGGRAGAGGQATGPPAP